jgi:peptidyl-prolyl cis-trans isomerase C
MPDLLRGQQPRYLQGQALHVRHILFAVAPEVNVHALLVQAERALVELSRPGVAPQRFAELAAELSACPTRAIGGDLGWVGPHDCEPELANELFDQRHSRWGMGVHPRLIHTGHGFHIIEVLGRRKGRPIPYPQARASIAGDLAVQRQAMARENSLRSLIAQARVQGIDVNTLLLEESLRFWCHD